MTRAGLYSNGPDDRGFPTWTIFKTYHWQQRFPARRILHIKHEYEPERGLQYIDQAALQNGKEPYATLSDSCVDPSLKNKLIAAAAHYNGVGDGESGLILTTWVDYILTTANTWKTPIKDFELVVERPKPEQGFDELHSLRVGLQFDVSFCWDGKVEQRGPDLFVARIANFVPKRELRVMFFQVGN